LELKSDSNSPSSKTYLNQIWAFLDNLLFAMLNHVELAKIVFNCLKHGFNACLHDLHQKWVWNTNLHQVWSYCVQTMNLNVRHQNHVSTCLHDFVKSQHLLRLSMNYVVRLQKHRFDRLNLQIDVICSNIVQIAANQSNLPFDEQTKTCSSLFLHRQQPCLHQSHAKHQILSKLLKSLPNNEWTSICE